MEERGAQPRSRVPIGCGANCTKPFPSGSKTAGERKGNRLFCLGCMQRASEQFRNDKSRTAGEAVYCTETESKASQQDSYLPMNSGTRGRLFQVRISTSRDLAPFSSNWF